MRLPNTPMTYENIFFPGAAAQHAQSSASSRETPPLMRSEAAVTSLEYYVKHTTKQTVASCGLLHRGVHVRGPSYASHIIRALGSRSKGLSSPRTQDVSEERLRLLFRSATKDVEELITIYRAVGSVPRTYPNALFYLLPEALHEGLEC